MWIFWALGAAIAAALVIVLTKAGLKNVDSSLAFAIQSVFILLITWGVILVQGNFSDLKEIDNKAWILLICAGIATTLSTLFSFKALSMGPASYVVTIERLSLVFAIILSIIFLKEKITWQLLTGAAIMVVGAVLVALSESKE
ncbi:EamA family transporter [Arcticibacter sp.]|uniref:EamA family transporter n=1 Tax=Arcticibacter sp. TaxID=1872630 RepID=UPI00389052CB